MLRFCPIIGRVTDQPAILGEIRSQGSVTILMDHGWTQVTYFFRDKFPFSRMTQQGTLHDRVNE
jgi:hypothetical protein